MCALVSLQPSIIRYWTTATFAEYEFIFLSNHSDWVCQDLFIKDVEVDHKALKSYEKNGNPYKC